MAVNPLAAFGAATAFQSAIGFGASERAAQIARTNYQHRYQWTMADMRKAGLNPILAASVGGGTGPPAPPAAQIQGAINTGKDASMAFIQKRLLDAQTRKTIAEAEITEAGVPIANLKAESSAKAIAFGRKIVKMGAEQRTIKRKSTKLRRNYQSGSTTSDGFFKLPPLGRARGGRQ